jgi:molecular chaperone DnaK (HSP70)
MVGEIRETVGFDLGHGETAVARAVIEVNAPPEMLEIHGRKTQITALGLHPEKGVIVGEQALTMPGVTQLQVGFKRKPNDDPEYRRLMRQYFETYYRLLLQSKQVRGGMETQFIVGCPSGWSLDDQSRYEALLRESGIPQLKVVPESRAALMHAKESGKFKLEELKSPILIVDIGSLTTDFTLLENLAIRPKDFGDNTLGGSLIDKAILRPLSANEGETVGG